MTNVVKYEVFGVVRSKNPEDFYSPGFYSNEKSVGLFPTKEEAKRTSSLINENEEIQELFLDEYEYECDYEFITQIREVREYSSFDEAIREKGYILEGLLH